MHASHNALDLARIGQGIVDDLNRGHAEGVLLLALLEGDHAVPHSPPPLHMPQQLPPKREGQPEAAARLCFCSTLQAQ